MTQENEIVTEIKLSGTRLNHFLTYKNVSGAESDGNGMVVARFSGDENCIDSAFDRIGLDFDLVNDSRDRVVVIFSSGLRRRGRKDMRKVSINHRDGVGFQRVTKGVDIVVQTNAPAGYFERNKS